MENLPEEVMIRIFSSGLSLNTLFQCMAVCTTWRNIVLRDPHFAKMHLTRATQVNLPGLVFRTPSSSGNRSQLCLVDYNSEDAQDHMHDTISKGPLGICFDPGFKFDSIFSCNGLLCLCEPLNNNPIYVCNPVTGDHITLPGSPQYKDPKFISGFGFDATTNEYKALRIKYFDRDHGLTYRPEAEVYTLGSGVWRSIGKVRYRLILNTRAYPININGVLHWMAASVYNSAIARFILAWDLRDEKFRRIPLPVEFGKNKDSDTICLTKHNKCLSILDFENWYSIKLWVMKDYNVRESWTILTDDWIAKESFIVKASIRYWYGRGDCGSDAEIHVNAVYNPEDGCFLKCEKIQVLEVEADGAALSHRIYTYVMNLVSHVGSFVSVNGGN